MPRPVRSGSASRSALTVYTYPHSGQVISLCRPIRVGAIEPVGITNPSASMLQSKNARNTTTNDSIDSRPPRDRRRAGRRPMRPAAATLVGFLSSPANHVVPRIALGLAPDPRVPAYQIDPRT